MCINLILNSSCYTVDDFLYRFRTNFDIFEHCPCSDLRRFDNFLKSCETLDINFLWDSYSFFYRTVHNDSGSHIKERHKEPNWHYLCKFIWHQWHKLSWVDNLACFRLKQRWVDIWFPKTLRSLNLFRNFCRTDQKDSHLHFHLVWS